MSRSAVDPVVEAVREANDIAELIGAQVELKRVGSRLRGLCPFHAERTPSFYVSPAHQNYHCFGCGESGDVFSFLMSQEKMTFPEALRHLAERAGIALPKQQGPSSELLERMRQALRVARAFYAARLASAHGQSARDYLNRRVVPEELWGRFDLGLAPDAWDGLLEHARQLLSDRALVESGLAVEGDRGRVYDRFRNRLMVPIDTASGSPVGFGGRILGEGEPKYLNSPETALYRKGTILFGIAQAREAIRRAGRVLVVEGYFDVMAFAARGIGETVGTCGTALTREQVALLSRLGASVVLVFDGDPAGLRAAHRALPSVVAGVPEVRVVVPPSGKDPDLWIREEGPQAVQEAIAGSKSPLGFLEDQMTVGVLTWREATDQAVTLLQAIPDPLVRDLWSQEASGRFGIRVEAFRERIAAVRTVRPKEGPDAPQTARKPPVRAWTQLEASCLRAALAHPAWAGDLSVALQGEFPVSEAIPLLRWIEEEAESAVEGELSTATLLSRAGRSLPGASRLHALAALEEAPLEEPARLVEVLQRRAVRRRLAEVNRAVRRAQESGNQEELSRVLAEKQRLAQEQARLHGIDREPPNPRPLPRD